MADDETQGSEQLPTVREWLSNSLGVEIPGLPALPQTIKNADKAIGKVLLSLGANLATRVDSNTGKVKTVAKIEIEDIVRDAEERRKLENRAAITKAAIEDINEEPGSADANSEIEDDWLNAFARIAEDKSSADLQKLFGKILAGEIRKPGSFSLRTLQFVATLSRDEAHRISDFYAYVLAGHIAPLPNDVNIEAKPGFEARALMEELGLATSPNTIGGFSMNYQLRPRSTLPLKCTKIAIIIQNDTDEELKLSVSCQILTKPGKELGVIANPPETPIEYANGMAELLFEQLTGVRTDDVAAGKIKVMVVQAVPVENGWRIGEILYTASSPSR